LLFPFQIVLTERANARDLLQSLPLFNSSSPFQIVLTEHANHARDLLQSLPLFNSNFPFQIVLTERANHARDLLQSLPLAHLDGVISVGGDGMFAEVKKSNCYIFL
jgi:hypothetical protein